MDRKQEWEVSDAVNKRYYEEIKRLKGDMEKAGLDLESEEGRRRFREAVLELNRCFFVVLPTGP
jgi:hypothetical protein